MKIGADATITNNEGISLLWVASKGGHDEIVLHLLNEHRNSININENHLGYTVLHMAAQNGHSETIKIIGISPMITLCYYSNCIEGNNHAALVNSVNFDGVSPLWLAAQNGCLDAVKALLGNFIIICFIIHLFVRTECGGGFGRKWRVFAFIYCCSEWP